MHTTHKAADEDVAATSGTKSKDGVSNNNAVARGFKRLKESDKFGALMTSTDMLFKSGREENKQMKAAFGVFTGILIGGLLCLLLIESFDYSPISAGIVATLVTVLICVALALWSACRCIIALVFPNFFTNKGRGLMMSIILSLILSGPIQNITDNSRETGSSMACIAEVVANQTKAMRKQLAEPMKQMADYVARNQKEMAEAQKEITKHIDDLVKQFQAIDQDLQTVTNQVNVVYQECVSIVDKPFQSCLNMCIFPISKSVCQTLCSHLNALKTSCEVVKVADLTAINTKLRNEFHKAESYFIADVVIEGNFYSAGNSSKNVDSIKAEIDEEIDGTVYSFKTFTSILKKILSVTLLIMFLNAFWYFRNYMSKDNYDNIYITKEFRNEDDIRKSKGENNILPLRKRELSEYVQTRSLRLTPVELAYCTKGLVQVFVLVLLCSIVIFGDYCLFYVLDLVNKFGTLVVSLSAETRFKVSVVGEGPIAIFYRILLGDINLDKLYLSNIDVGGCIPNPTAPYESYSMSTFIALYVMLLCVVLLRGYGMRLRRKIAAYYYPEQERQRIEYLYKSIKHRRQAYQRFLRQEIKSAHKESLTKDKFRLSAWVNTSLPCCSRCVSKRETRQCNSCEETNPKLLTNCNGKVNDVVCSAVYCEECRSILNGVCPICNRDDVVYRV